MVLTIDLDSSVALIQQFLSEINWGALDYLIIDSISSCIVSELAPPGTSDEHISIVNFLRDVGIDGWYSGDYTTRSLSSRCSKRDSILPAVWSEYYWCD